MTNSDAATLVEGLAALPADVRDILAERATKQAAEDVNDYARPGERMNDLTSTDRSRTTVFSMQTGDPHEILVIDRPRALRSVIPGTNRPAFWAPGMPGRPPKRNVGQLKCFLHPESDERELVDAAGYAGRYCNDGDPSKNNQESFRALDHKENHERRKHPGAWQAVERYRARIREQEYRQLQEANLASQKEMTKAMQAIAELAVNGAKVAEVTKAKPKPVE